MNNPEYRILNIGFEKKSNFINHKTSYGFGFLLNRKHMNVLQVLSNNNLCYEFEIIDDNKLLMLYAGYLLFIEKENN
ncbi:MAG TPA: hypothetical protein DC049_18105 [Spirochaetia bacterium]|nr:hypothetical protein [Spirochaetia bacterium]